MQPSTNSNRLDAALYVAIGMIGAALGQPFLTSVAKGILSIVQAGLVAWKATRHGWKKAGTDGKN